MGIRAAISAKYSALASHQQRIVLTAGATFLSTAIAAMLAGCHPAAATDSGEADAGPAFVRQGENLSIPAASPLRKRVVVAPVNAATSAHTISLPGVVEADPAHTVNILPPLTGRLTQLLVKLGDQVKQGQLLAVISSPDLDQAYSDVEKARDALDLARKALERARAVHDAGANAVKDFEQANSGYVQALSEFKRADERLLTLTGGVRTTASARGLNITAPVSGAVTALNYGNGSFITDPTATMLTISNLDNVWVTANVPEDMLAAVTKGQPADVTLPAYPGQKLHGTISFVSAVLEADTHRNKTRISFANSDGKLKPNMYATVDIAVPQNKQVVVPTSALLMNNDSTTVFVETSPWNFVRRTVELGQEDDDRVRILSGLSNSDRIVVRGGVLLND